MKSNGSTQSSKDRHITFVVPNDYSATIYIYMAGNGDGKRTCFIDTVVGTSVNESYLALVSEEKEKLSGTSKELSSGKYYLCSDNNVVYYNITFTLKSLGNEIEPINFTYDLNYETENRTIESKTDKYGRVIENEYLPTRDGYDFAGWHVDAAGSTEFDFANPITDEITLYAKWIKVINVEATGNIVGNLESLNGLTLTLEDSKQELTYTHTISDSLTYNFGTIKNGTYKLSINDTTGLVTITSATEIVIDEATDAVGDIVIETLEKMNKTYSWDVTKGFVKGYNGNGLIALEDMPYSEEKGYAQGSSNPVISNNTPSSGAAVKLVAGKDGTVRVKLQFGSSAKTNYASCDGEVVAYYNGQSEEYVLTFDVEAGKTYYVYGSGTKFMFSAFSFTEKVEATAVINYQYDNDETPTAVRFIGTLVVDPYTVESVTLHFVKDGVAANKDVQVYTLYTSVAGQAEFAEAANTYYAVYVLNGVQSVLNQELEVTMTVTFNNGAEALVATRTFTLGA